MKLQISLGSYGGSTLLFLKCMNCGINSLMVYIWWLEHQPEPAALQSLRAAVNNSRPSSSWGVERVTWFFDGAEG